MCQPTLPASDVVLRPWRDDDVALVVAAGRDPHIPLITTVPADGDEVAARAFVARQHRRVADGEGHPFVIADATTDVGVGQIGLWPGRFSVARIGYWVDRAHRGRGVVTAALRALTTWAFDERGLERLELLVEPWNAASWRAAERAGYRCEGLARGAEPVGGTRRDMLLYARLATDLDPAPTDGGDGGDDSGDGDDDDGEVPLLVVPPATETDPHALLAGVLDELRDAVARTLDGLSDAQLRVVHPPVSWTPVGLVSHLTAVERRWLRWGFLGESIDDPHADDEWTPSADVATVLGRWRAEVARSRAILASATFTTPSRLGGRFRHEAPSLGRILAHLVQEYARHAGQLDVVREAIE